MDNRVTSPLPFTSLADWSTDQSAAHANRPPSPAQRGYTDAAIVRSSSHSSATLQQANVVGPSEFAGECSVDQLEPSGPDAAFAVTPVVDCEPPARDVRQCRPPSPTALRRRNAHVPQRHPAPIRPAPAMSAPMRQAASFRRRRAATSAGSDRPSPPDRPAERAAGRRARRLGAVGQSTGRRP